MRLFQLPGAVLVETETRWFRLAGRDVGQRRSTATDLSGWVTGQIADATLIDGTPDLASLLPPIGSQEVWAAGVTYYRSRTARMEESKSAGGGDFYDRVYDAARPELFFKATPHRVRGHGSRCASARTRSGTCPSRSWRWSSARAATIVGYTIGNDMSSRDIEGENPLYLPQAKVYDGSCGLGPCVLISSAPLPSRDRGPPGDSTRRVRARSRARRRWLR